MSFRRSGSSRKAFELSISCSAIPIRSRRRDPLSEDLNRWRIKFRSILWPWCWATMASAARPHSVVSLCGISFKILQPKDLFVKKYSKFSKMEDSSKFYLDKTSGDIMIRLYDPCKMNTWKIGRPFFLSISTIAKIVREKARIINPTAFNNP